MLAAACSTLIYWGVMQHIPFVTAYALMIRELYLTPATLPTVLLGLGAVVLLFGVYMLGAHHAGAAANLRLPRLLVLGAPLLFAGILLLTAPFTSTDIFDYLFRGRMLAHYQVNTYLATPHQFPDDPLLRFVVWPESVTAYGPIWEYMSLLTARLAGERPGSPIFPVQPQLLHLMFAYKLLSLLSYLLCGASIWAATSCAAPQRRWQAVYLWLWNPLVLWEIVAAAHNDAWMLWPVMLALGLVLRWIDTQSETTPAHLAPSRDRGNLLPPTVALLLITLGGLIKFTVLLLGPAVLMASLRRLPGWRQRLMLTLLAGSLCFALVVVNYAPFWEGWSTLQNFNGRGDLINVSPIGVLCSVLLLVLSAKEVIHITFLSSIILLAAGTVVTAWISWRRPDQLARYMLGLMLWFLLICNPWFQSWYVIWLVPLATLHLWPGRIWYAVNTFCVAGFFFYVVNNLVPPVLLTVLIDGLPLIALTWPRTGVRALQLESSG